MDNLPARQIYEAEPVTDLERILISYDQLGIDDLLDGYAVTDGSGGVTQDDLDKSFAHFALAITTVAFKGEGLDITTVRGAFERVFTGMNHAASKKLGYAAPQSFIEAVLIKLGRREPRIQEHFRPLDNRYWKQQFMKEYQEGIWVKRNPNEPEQQYAARYIHRRLHGFLLAPYSYIQQAVEN